MCFFLPIIRKYSNKSGNVRQFCYHLVGISEYIIRGEERKKTCLFPSCWCSVSNCATVCDITAVQDVWSVYDLRSIFQLFCFFTSVFAECSQVNVKTEIIINCSPTFTTGPFGC